MAPAVPINDLYMIQLFEQFASVDKKVASVAEKMRLHLWYLCIFEETESAAKKHALDAEAVLGSLDLKFVMELFIYEKMLKITHILSKYSQDETLNLASANELVHGTEESLIQLKTTEEYHSLWVEIVAFRKQSSMLKRNFSIEPF